MVQSLFIALSALWNVFLDWEWLSCWHYHLFVWSETDGWFTELCYRSTQCKVIWRKVCSTRSTLVLAHNQNRTVARFQYDLFLRGLCEHVDDSSIGTELCDESLSQERVYYISLQSLSLTPVTTLAFIPDVIHTHGYWRVCIDKLVLLLFLRLSLFLHPEREGKAINTKQLLWTWCQYHVLLLIILEPCK